MLPILKDAIMKYKIYYRESVLKKTKDDDCFHDCFQHNDIRQ